MKKDNSLLKAQKVKDGTNPAISLNPVLAEVQKGFKDAEYTIGGKKVSEYRFFKSIADDIKGKKKKMCFYWTDEKVMLLLECMDIKITKETLAEFKAHFR